MTQKTVVALVERLRDGDDLHSRIEAADLIQSLSDRLAVQNDLLRRARSLIRPYCEADEELRAFSDELTVCLVEEKE